MRYIIVGNSNYKSFSKCYIPQKDDYLIGLDDGTFTIIDCGYHVNESWGDFDFSTRLGELDNKDIILRKFPKEKNETDLELVLMNHKFEGEIIIYDATGGRIDHELVNIWLLKKYKELNITIKDSENEIKYISKAGCYSISKEQYTYVSILTLDNATIEITNAKYKLKKTHLTAHDTFTTSNSFYNNIFEFNLIDGEILLIRSI